MFTKTNTHKQNETTTAAKPAVVQTAVAQPAQPAQTELTEAQRAQVKRVIIGVDLHKSTCANTIILSGSPAQPAQTIATERMAGWVKQQLAHFPNAQFHIGYEAGPCGYWLARELQALPRVDCLVMAPDLLNGRRKTDKRDSRALAAKLRSPRSNLRDLGFAIESIMRPVSAPQSRASTTPHHASILRPPRRSSRIQRQKP